ncbi:hypothetical protein ABT392_07865 [Paucibacter sp. JuS9]|uniref:hypothetical protein n=1 Tax=Paucibacter sp. JuS9 TaxID=3228748 RepID=UPI0037565E30
MSVDPTRLLIPEADFVVEIDDLLEKHRPSLTVPWSLHDVPAWARHFRPRNVIDIGAGLGAFTSSFIECLKHWSCLGDLRKVLLLDGEQALFGADPVQGAAHVCQAVRAKLGASAPDAEIAYDMRNVEVVGSYVHPLNDLPWQADLIVASHVTYYLGDGSGLDLVRSLGAHHLAPGGRIWVVIRRLHCPIYERRSRTLELMNREDPKPLDYAERFLAMAAQALPGLKILAHRTLRFAINRPEPERLRAIHLLMWRAPPDEVAFPDGWRATKEAARSATPFHEEHLVLGRAE